MTCRLYESYLNVILILIVFPSTYPKVQKLCEDKIHVTVHAGNK